MSKCWLEFYGTCRGVVDGLPATWMRNSDKLYAMTIGLRQGISWKLPCLLTGWFPSKTRLNRTRHISLGTCMISGFRREVDEIWARLGYYAAYGGNYLPTFRDKLSVPSPRVKKSRTQTPNLLQNIYLLNIPWCINTISNFHLLLGSAFSVGHNRTVRLFELKNIHTYFIWCFFDSTLCVVWWWTKQNV
jgi:hypothetical protein